MRRRRLQEANRRTTRILESITDAFFALDRDWRFTYLNDQAERLLSRARADLLGKNVWDEFPAAVGTDFDRQYHRAVDERTAVAFEAYYPPPLDTWFEVGPTPPPTACPSTSTTSPSESAAGGASGFWRTWRSGRAA